MKYNEFCNQVIEKSKEIDTKWELTKGLVDKVKNIGVFEEFYGDTTVFKLVPREIEVVEKIQSEILNGFEEYVTKLNPETFHMTLQSLSNKYTTLYGGVNEINEEAKKNKELMKKAFQEISNKYSGSKVKMKFERLCISNIGITLYLIPSSEKDYKVLMECGEILGKYDYHKNKEVGLYTPHISFTYFTPLKESKYEEIIKRVEKFNENIKENIEFSLEVDRIAYQYHHNMNDFRDVLNVEDF